VLDDGTAWCWGEDASGQLGDASMAGAQATPIPLSSPTGIVAMGAGLDQTCAVQKGGALECWGGNEVGEVGTGTSASSVPPTVVGSGFVDVAGGFDYTCGARADGTVACWGYGDHGQLGNMAYSAFDEPVPTAVQGVAGAVSVSASEYVTCALTEGGGVLCWGIGPLGDGTTNDSATPVAVQGLPGPVSRVAVGGMHACALLQDGTVMCWGYGGYGELGLGTGVDLVPLPQAVPLAPSAVDISSGEYHTCALLADGGGVQCWGMGSSFVTNEFVPTTVPGTSEARAIASGQSHDCAILENALLADSRVVCWGDNDIGQLGDGTLTGSATPVVVTGLP
jgi:alpha-tubulin suppressor-like RCC1 family protein